MVEQCTQHCDRGDRVILFVGQRTIVTGGQGVIDQFMGVNIFCWTDRTDRTGHERTLGI